MKGTIKELFINEFNLDIDNMKLNEPYDVSESNIGIKAYNQKTGQDEFVPIIHAIKKSKQPLYRIKLSGRESYEEPVAGKHMFAVMKSFDSNDYDFGFVENLVENAKVILENNKVDTIEKIEKIADDYVYDIETETGNYYSNGILSHNSLMAHLPSQTGGTAIRFFSSTRCRVQKMDSIKNGDEVIGIQIRVRNYKNKTSIPNRDALMDLYFNGGFDSDSEYFSFIINFGFIHKAGGWFDWTDTDNILGEMETNKKGEQEPKVYKWQGAAKVQEWLKANHKVYDMFKEKVDAKLCVSNELDANNTDPDIDDAKALNLRITEPNATEKAEIEELAKEALEDK